MASENNSMTPGMAETQNAVEFINKTVLKPDVTPIEGTAKPMVDQAVGMMAQDLQSFLQGFEQIGLVAMARLANNILTYGTYFGPKPGSDGGSTESKSKGGADTIQQPALNPQKIGADAFSDLFKVIGDYGKAKAEISALINNANSTNPSAHNPSTSTQKKKDQPITNLDKSKTDIKPPSHPSTPSKETTKKKSWFSKKHNS